MLLEDAQGLGANGQRLNLAVQRQDSERTLVFRRKKTHRLDRSLLVGSQGGASEGGKGTPKSARIFLPAALMRSFRLSLRASIFSVMCAACAPSAHGASRLNRF